MSNILIVEDDAVLRSGIRELLQESGYRVSAAENCQDAQKIRMAAKSSGEIFDLYILDIMLENGSGFSLCEEIRQEEETPVIFLSALDDEDHIIRGLNLGADDYISKPFHRRELLARVAAHIRRGNQQSVRNNAGQQQMYSAEHGSDHTMNVSDGGAFPVIRSGDIVFRMGEERIYIQGKEVLLRRLEAALLIYFMQSNGRLLRREQILEYIWDKDGLFVEDNTLSVHISRLRKRIGKYQGEEYIETIRGIGYRWNQTIYREGER